MKAAEFAIGFVISLGFVMLGVFIATKVLGLGETGVIMFLGCMYCINGGREYVRRCE